MMNIIIQPNLFENVRFLYIIFLACASSCSGGCAYRLECFQCSGTQVYDLESMKCVDSCPDDEIRIESDLIHSLKVCRKSEYYIDGHSNEILELGTRAYPYKSLNMAMHELFNFISALDIEVI